MDFSFQFAGFSIPFFGKKYWLIIKTNIFIILIFLFNQIPTHTYPFVNTTLESYKGSPSMLYNEVWRVKHEKRKDIRKLSGAWKSWEMLLSDGIKAFKFSTCQRDVGNWLGNWHDIAKTNMNWRTVFVKATNLTSRWFQALKRRLISKPRLKREVY